MNDLFIDSLYLLRSGFSSGKLTIKVTLVGVKNVLILILEHVLRFGFKEWFFELHFWNSVRELDSVINIYWKNVYIVPINNFKLATIKLYLFSFFLKFSEVPTGLLKNALNSKMWNYLKSNFIKYGITVTCLLLL